MNLSFYGREYFFDVDALSDKPVFVQIGVFHLNYFAELCKQFGKDGRIIVYEPSKGICNQIAEKKLPAITHNKAVVGGRDGTVPFYFNAGAPQANTIFGSGDWDHVPCVSVETIFKENNLSHIDVLLLDCEGSEFGIIDEILEKPKLKVKQINVEIDLDKQETPHQWEFLLERLRGRFEIVIEWNIIYPDPTPIYFFTQVRK